VSPIPTTNSPEHDLIVEYVSKTFGGSPQMDWYGDKTEQLKVAILYCPDRPMNNVTSYSTVGLSDHAMPWGEGEFPTRVELAGVCVSEEPTFANVLASASFCIARSGLVYHPGTVMQDYVKLVFPSIALPHLYLTSPFLWGASLSTLDVVTRKVSWLLAMPISESERVFLRENGEESFEHILEEAHVDISDLSRDPVV
jgi:hypothetical protein